jgi:hypothetical protein
VIGLLVFLAHLHLLVRTAASPLETVFWGAATIALTGFALGAVLIDLVPLGLANGGRDIPDRVTYMFTQAGFGAGWGVGGTFLGVALLFLAARNSRIFPSWLRYATMVAGIFGLASLAFFPFFLLPVWALVTGIWLLTAGNRPAAAVDQSPVAP